PFRSVVDVFLVFVALLLPPRPTPFPYTTLFRSAAHHSYQRGRSEAGPLTVARQPQEWTGDRARSLGSGESIGPDDTQRSEVLQRDRKSTRLNSSHVKISYAVFCLKKQHNMRGHP